MLPKALAVADGTQTMQSYDKTNVSKSLPLIYWVTLTLAKGTISTENVCL